VKKTLNYIENGLKRFYDRIIVNTKISTINLAIYRIFIGMFLLLFPFNFIWIGELPSGLFMPGVLTLGKNFSSFPPSIFFQITTILIIISSVAILLGLKTRVFFILLSLLLIINYSFQFSLGKIDHNSILLISFFIVMSFTNSGAKMAILPDMKSKSGNLAIAILALIIVFGFFTAGVPKAINWIDFNLSESGIYAWYFDGYYGANRNRLFAHLFHYIPIWFAEIMDYFTVVFELSGIIFLLKGRKWWIGYLFMLSTFHLFNTLFFNIDYINHLPVLGLWLLSPGMNKYRFALLPFLFLLLFTGLLKSAVAWVLFLGISFFFIIENSSFRIFRQKSV